MKRTIDLTNVMENVKTNVIPVLESITTEGFNGEVQSTFLGELEGYLNGVSAEELESYLAMAVGEQILNSIGYSSKKED